MTSRELVIKTLNQAPVPRVPRDLWLPPGDEVIRADELAEIGVRFPSDIIEPDVGPALGKRSSSKPNKSGDQTDAWGCVWHQPQRGALLELKASPLAEAGKIAGYRPPLELLDPARFAKVNKSCTSTNRFVLARAESRLFDRLRHLRGGEAALVDLARGTKDIRGLLNMLHDFACKEIELWAGTEVDGVAIHDDWGTPEGLLIAPEMWRELFRPLYREYCRILHAADKFVFFQSDGNVSDIIGDLIKMGVDAIHLEWRYMDVERLAKRYRGRVTFWGEMDRRRLREPGTPEEFRQAVLAVRKALDFGSGGVIAQCEWAPEVRIQTIAAFFEQWIVPLPMNV